VSEVFGARYRGGQDAKVCMLFASLLNELVGYHDAYVFMFLCGGSGIFIFNVFGVLLAGVRQLVSSKEVGEWAHVSNSFTLPPFKKIFLVECIIPPSLQIIYRLPPFSLVTRVYCLREKNVSFYSRTSCSLEHADKNAT
jgi:hypothetical protein